MRMAPENSRQHFARSTTSHDADPIAVSNICWSNGPLEQFFDAAVHSGAQGVELAASLIWPEPIRTTPAERAAIRSAIEARGLSLVGLHALLFSRKDLQLLSDGSARASVGAYLRALVDVCAELGGRSLVLGGPRSRVRGALTKEEADRRGASILHEVGEHAVQRSCVIALEALPAPACDFITNLSECAAMVQLADTPGVQLHFDTGAADMTEATSSEQQLLQFLNQACHFHINDYDIAPPGSETPLNHLRWSRLVNASTYHGWRSIEMKCPQGKRPEDIVDSAVRFVRSNYARSGESK